jgi:diketogulonate reductase-like aldo/keto reductase
MSVLPVRRGSDGIDYPAVGFGTYKLNGAPGMDVIREAVHGGYRLLDTAVNYQNEGAVGAAVRTSRVPRERLLVASKLPGRFHAADKAARSVEESLYRTG